MSDRPTEEDLALLALLHKGVEFTSACETMGDDGVKAAWHCLASGWINRGQITAAGRALVPAFLRGPGLQGTMPKFTVTDLRTGEIVSHGKKPS